MIASRASRGYRSPRARCVGVPYEFIDATGGIVAPGFIDPHEHLLGSSGEGGLVFQSPVIFLQEIVCAGITTAVGVLGVDTTMKNVAALLGRVKALSSGGDSQS